MRAHPPPADCLHGQRLSPAGRLTLPPLRVESPPRPARNENETLEGVERAYVARVLEETHGVISGPRGAAARLGLKRTTLQSMLKRFGLPLPRDAAKSAFEKALGPEVTVIPILCGETQRRAGGLHCSTGVYYR